MSKLEVAISSHLVVLWLHSISCWLYLASRLDSSSLPSFGQLLDPSQGSLLFLLQMVFGPLRLVATAAATHQVEYIQT